MVFAKSKILSKVKISINEKEIEVLVIESKKKDLIIGNDFLLSLGINVNNIVLEKLNLKNNLKRSESTDEIEEKYLLGSMIFDEDNVILLDIDEFKQLDIIMEELQLLKDDLEVVLSKAFNKRQNGNK